MMSLIICFLFFFFALQTTRMYEDKLTKLTSEYNTLKVRLPQFGRPTYVFADFVLFMFPHVYAPT